MTKRLKRYSVAVDIPFIVEVHAKDVEEAEIIGDGLIAQAYNVAEQALFAADTPVGMGNRYDETEVEEYDDE